MGRRGSEVRRVFLGLSLTGLVAVLALGAFTFLMSHGRPSAAMSPGEPGVRVGKSGLPVPRFVSLKAGRANVRVGPGDDYKVTWVFTRAGLPVEIIAEFDNWRRVRDSDGQVGWVFHSLLSGKRTAVVAPWEKGAPFALRASPADTAGVTAYLQPGVMGAVDRCGGGWCEIDGKGFSGWIESSRLWGVYPDEDID
jgi:SH3-like domain-containing protein